MWRRTLAAIIALITIAGSAAVAVAAPTRWSSDHILIVVTAGAKGAKGFDIAVGGPRARTGTGPGVFAIGIGHSKRGGGMFPVEQAGGPLEITTTKELGGARVRLTDSPTGGGEGQFEVQFSIGELGPHESALGIAVLGNARFAPLTLPPHKVKTGNVKVRMIQLGGTVVTRVGDPGASGAAAVAATAGGGLQTSTPPICQRHRRWIRDQRAELEYGLVACSRQRQRALDQWRRHRSRSPIVRRSPRPVAAAMGRGRRRTRGQPRCVVHHPGRLVLALPALPELPDRSSSGNTVLSRPQSPAPAA